MNSRAVSHMPSPGVPKVRRRAGDGATAGTPPLRCALVGAPLRRVGRPLGHRNRCFESVSHILQNSVGATVRGLRRAPSDCLRPLRPPAERYGPAKAGPFIAAMGGQNLAR